MRPSNFGIFRIWYATTPKTINDWLDSVLYQRHVTNNLYLLKITQQRSYQTTIPPSLQ
jgi:hypothetical protein